MDRGVLKGGDRECEVGGVKRSEEVVSGGKRVKATQQSLSAQVKRESIMKK